METGRREFLKGTAWMLGAAAVAGCALDKVVDGGGSMANFRVAPMKKVRVGFIGVGERGTAAVKRATLIPGVETAALCDLRPAQVEAAKKWLQENRRPGALGTTNLRAGSERRISLTF